MAKSGLKYLRWFMHFVKCALYKCVHFRFCSFVVQLVGTISLFCEATVPFILKKVYWPQPTKKRLFHPQIAKKKKKTMLHTFKESSIIIAIPCRTVCCMYVQRARHVIGPIQTSVCLVGKKKAKDCFGFNIFFFRFV